MAKSYHLLKFLYVAAVLFCGNVEGADLGVRYQVWDVRGQGFNTDAARVKKIYDAEVGVREQGRNAGRRVEEYLAYVNLNKGNAWCAAFVCWVYGRAGVDNPRTGWSPALFSDSKVIWRRQAAAALNRLPATADIFSIWFADKKRIAHTGFIDQWQDSWLITVEGNTNAEGSREGDGVYRKRRLTRSIHSVARYIRKSNPLSE